MQYKKISELKWEPRFTYKKIVPFDLGTSKFQIIKFKRGAEIADHYHMKTKEVFLTLSGSATLYINGTPHRMNKDNIFLIEPKDFHRIVADNDVEVAIFKPIEGGESDIFWANFEDSN